MLVNASAVMARLRRTDPRITPVFTLRHLSELTDIPYRYLRQVVGRRAALGYRHISLRKHVPGRRRTRLISIPPESLMAVQSWIVRNILQYVDPHEASCAFHPGSRPYYAAAEHCGCEFLLKVDIEDFFHSISEGSIAAVFEDIGFQKLLSFEMARLVTEPIDRSRPVPNPSELWPKITFYQCEYEGMLPQGAPTSPMLANLVMRDVDEKLAQLSRRHGMRYTRYADDLAFSSPKKSPSTLGAVRAFRTKVLTVLKEAGFKPNLRKTVIRGPGSRKIVLGMLVDGDLPRLTREFKDMLRLHLHYLSSPQHGPSAHAKVRRTGVSSLYHHVRGLIAWAQCVEPAYGKEVLSRFRAVPWPPVQPR